MSLKLHDQESRSRLLIFLMLVLLGFFTLFFLTHIILVLFFDSTLLDKPFDWLTLFANIVLILIMGFNWYDHHTSSKKREKLSVKFQWSEEQKEQLIQAGISKDMLEPFNYKKSRLQVGTLNAIAIVINVCAFFYNLKAL